MGPTGLGGWGEDEQKVSHHFLVQVFHLLVLRTDITKQSIQNARLHLSEEPAHGPREWALMPDPSTPGTNTGTVVEEKDPVQSVSLLWEWERVLWK